MLFSVEDLNTRKPISNGVNHHPIKITEDYSFFMKSLELISESENTLREMTDDIIAETFLGDLIDKIEEKKKYNEGFSFTNMIRTIFQMFLKAINYVYTRFKALIVKIFGGDRAITKYKDAIMNYDEDITIDFPYYNYTNLDSNIPNDDLKILFSDEYDNLSEKLSKIADIKDKDMRIQELNRIYQELCYEEGNGNLYNKIRARIIESNIIITEEDYANQLFRFFRDNATSPTVPDSKLYPNNIRNALTRFLNSDRLIKLTQKQYSNMDTSAKQTCKKNKKLNADKVFNSYTPIDYDIEYALNQVLRLESGKISKMCNLILMAYSAKLDALKEAVVQDRKILRKVISQLIIKEKV